MTKDARAASFVPSACSVLCFTHRNGNHRTSYLRYCLQPSQASKMGGGGLKPQGLTRVKRVLQATALADRQGEDGIRYVRAAIENLSTSMPPARSCARQRS